MDINIIVNKANGTFILKKINKNSKIKKMYEILEINDKDIYFIFNSKLLNNEKTFNDYNIKENSHLFEQKRLKGGIFSSIVNTLVIIVKFFKLILTYLDDFIMLFLKAFELLPSIFNPKKLIDDIIYGVSFGIKSVIGGMMSSISSGSSPNPVEETPESIPKVCVPPTLFNLIILIICPPLALFMNIGINNFYLTIICAILTIWGYYFPGLIFAALHIFC